MAFAALFLTIFLSCNVKKGLQAYFGAEITKPLNVSKTTIAENPSCQLLEEISQTEAPENQAIAFPFVAALFLSGVLFPVTRNAQNPIPFSGAVFLTSAQPLFLLFRKLII